MNAPTLFSQVQNDLGILHTILKHAQKLFEKGELDDDQSNSLKDVLRGCDEGFRDLKQLRERFDSIDAESQDNCERFGLGIEELRDIRERFTTYIQALNLLTTESMR